ncbi:MAG: hypothetical protein M1486_01385 [Gammaproteobacteria bacterium]|nr:hypothetical protein [Gammaproteobacteria bacterium]
MSDKKTEEYIEHWNVIEKIEILNEVGAGIIADFCRQLEKRNIEIEDRNNPIIILYWQTVDLKNNLINMDTMLELNNAQAQLNFVKQYVKKLG